MSEEPQATTTSFNAKPYLPLLLILFAGSGFAALIYEIVWYQLLQLAIGSTSVSLGILLATFMGGLCIGSILLPRLRLERIHPLRIYALLELGIGVLGILVLFAIPAIDRVYFLGAAQGLAGMLQRGVMAAMCMLVPTILMGASLPAIVRWIESTPKGVSWWGLLYGGNTAGAVLGCLFAGFYLLRIYNTAVATYAAAAVNLLVVAGSFWLSTKTPVQAALGESAPVPSEPEAVPVPNAAEKAASNWEVYVTIALSGACALGAEVVWTRLIAMMLGPTVYVFSIILAVFLVGLAFGSAAGSWLLERVRARLALGWAQALLAAGIAWTAYMVTDSLPYWPSLVNSGPWDMLAHDLLRCVVAILPPTLLWGASFTLSLGSVAKRSEDPGRVVGGIYAANTLGAIVGALAVSLALIPWIGTQNCQRLLVLLSVVSALFVLVPYIWRRRSIIVGALATVSVVVACLLAWRVSAIPGKVIAYGRWMSLEGPQAQVLETAEGRNSSVAITQWDDGNTQIDVNGHVEATTETYDMKLQRMVGDIPGLLSPHPVSVLGIGFGAGVTAGTFTTFPSIQKITICEIEPVIPPIATKYFAKQDYDVLYNPRTRMVYDDARHFLMTTKDKYDIIASDPLDVFVKGTAALYSKQYFEAVKRHLKPGGMFTLYTPLYETDERTLRSELATFFEVFPHGTLWANTVGGQGYDTVLMGQAEPLKINVDEVQQRLSSPGYAAVAESLREVGVYSAADLLSTFTAQKSDLASWLKGAEITQDSNLRLQYLAGWGFNADMEEALYEDMLRYRKMPSNIFTGSTEALQELWAKMSIQSNANVAPSTSDSAF
jgi:spermidine synthase